MTLIASSSSFAPTLGQAICNSLTTTEFATLSLPSFRQSQDDRPGPQRQLNFLRAPWSGLLDTLESCEDRWQTTLFLVVLLSFILIVIRSHSLSVIWHYYLMDPRPRGKSSRTGSITTGLHPAFALFPTSHRKSRRNTMPTFRQAQNRHQRSSSSSYAVYAPFAVSVTEAERVDGCRFTANQS